MRRAPISVTLPTDLQILEQRGQQLHPLYDTFRTRVSESSKFPRRGGMHLIAVDNLHVQVRTREFVLIIHRARHTAQLRFVGHQLYYRDPDILGSNPDARRWVHISEDGFSHASDGITPASLSSLVSSGAMLGLAQLASDASPLVEVGKVNVNGQRVTEFAGLIMASTLVNLPMAIHHGGKHSIPYVIKLFVSPNGEIVRVNLDFLHILDVTTDVISTVTPLLVERPSADSVVDFARLDRSERERLIAAL
jgi:hypothetical protein